MLRFRLVFTLALVALVIACGSKSPIAPTGPVVTGLTISGADAVLTGLSTTYTATATLADGTSRPVTPAWSSSNLEIATVDNAGLLAGRAHGSTTLTASSGGQTASKTVHVVNNYQGTWQGTFVVKRCDAPPGVCAGYEVDFFSFPIYLQVSQTGTDQSEITAVLILPSLFDIHAYISGGVTSDGRMHLAGSSELPTGDGKIWATFDVGAWDTTVSAEGGMTGRWTQRLSILLPPSTEYMDSELLIVKRISNTADSMSR